MHRSLFTVAQRIAGFVPPCCGMAGRIGLFVGITSTLSAAPVIEWECAGGKEPRLTEARIQELETAVRAGGGLLISFTREPGDDGLRLARLSPTTAWHTLMPRAARGPAAPAASAGDRDEGFFPHPITLTPDYRWDVSPLPAVERGIGRYERFEQSAPYLLNVLPANNTFWTRPLENRDWRVRLRTDDPYRTPILVTGRFGAGRVAVWGSSIAALKADPTAYETVRKWLADAEDPKADDLTTANSLTLKAVARVDDRTLRVTVTNNNNRPARGELVARFSTWERAVVGDGLASFELRAGETREIILAFPVSAADPFTGYAALVDRDEWTVRVGAIGAKGTLNAPELRVVADLRPPVRIELAADSLRTLKSYPFNANGPDDTLFFRNRMGAPTSRYAYKPGEVVNVTASVSLGRVNITEQATARDETKPDNRSIMGLNDGAIQNDKTPRDGFIAWNAWTGQGGRENRVTLTLPEAWSLVVVALHLQPDGYRNLDDANPSGVRVIVDGREVASADDLDSRIVAENGRVEIALPANTRGREVTLVFPWSGTRTPRNRQRKAPSVGEVELIAIDPATLALATPAGVNSTGSQGVGKTPSAGKARGELVLIARESLSGETRELSRTAVTLGAGEQRAINATFKLPVADDREGFWQIEARWAGAVVKTMPILSTSGKRALENIMTLRPPDAPELGFIVTRGFRIPFDTGTGTQEMPNPWGNADDLVWAYSRKLKQTGANARSAANRLYLNDSDLRHYSTPWISFPDGEDFYAVATPLLVEKMKADRRWSNSRRVVLAQSDRWDAAPEMDAMFTWTNFMEFDQWLRVQGLAGLKGRTRNQLSREITEQHESRWLSWNLDRYLDTLKRLHGAFAAEGKDLNLSAQGAPLVPPRAEAEVALVVQGTSDDSTWGLDHENLAYTTGRQAGIMAVNPSFRMSTLLQWGWNSAVVNNWRWYSPVGTTEPSRRHYYDRAWRGVLDPINGYRAMHAYGFNQNGGSSWTMSAHDWQEWWRLLERHTLLTPDAPIGVGIIRSTARFDLPESTVFGMGGDRSKFEIQRTQILFQHLHEAGLGASFVGNAAQIDRWPSQAPMVIVNPAEFSLAETTALKRWLEEGGRAVAFNDDSIAELSPGMNALFTGKPIGEVRGKPVVASARTLLIPIATENLESVYFKNLGSELREVIAPQLTFPEGTLGYGFKRGKLSYAVVEDWAEKAREVELRVRAVGGGTLKAVGLNDHRSLASRRDGDVWVITVPLRAGDGEVVVWQEREDKK